MRVAALVLLAVCLAVSVAAGSDRIVMQKMGLTATKAGGALEGLSEPERYSGYFKLNR